MNSPRTFWASFLGGLFLAAWLLHLLAQPWLDSLPDQPRNPGFRRGWLEYIKATPPKSPQEKLILLISHSQGYGREVGPSDIYSVQWENHLRANATGKQVRVVNWSLPGGTYFDFLIVSAAARDIHPDQIVIVTHAGTFSEGDRDRRGRETWASDAHYLLQDPGFRRRLEPIDLDPRMDLDLSTELFLARMWPAWRWRSWPAARLAQTPFIGTLFPREKSSTWFPPEFEFRRRPHIARSPDLNPSATRRIITQWLAATPDILLVESPTTASWRPATNPAWDELERIGKGSGISFLRPSDEFQEDDFITNTHFNASGHAKMARILAEATP